MPILIPANSTEDLRKLLRDPVKHWRRGYSAKSLADHWQDEDGFPAEISVSAEAEIIRPAARVCAVTPPALSVPGVVAPEHAHEHTR